MASHGLFHPKVLTNILNPMHNLFFTTPYNSQVAEHLAALGFRELCESITDPQAERHIIINNLTNTVWTCDSTNLEDSAAVVEAKYKTTITPTAATEVLSWGSFKA